MPSGKLIVISGPGGVGKDTIVKMLLKRHPELVRVVTYTARPPRSGEVNGVDYNFVSKAEFEQLIENGELLEWAKPRGSYYGTPRGPITSALRAGNQALMHINVDGVLALKDRLPGQFVSIFLTATSLDELKKRLIKRGNDSPEGIAKRLAETAREIKIAQQEYDHIVVNPTGHPEQAVAAIEKIIGY